MTEELTFEQTEQLYQIMMAQYREEQAARQATTEHAAPHETEPLKKKASHSVRLLRRLSIGGGSSK